jgi:hypothetical protein
MVLFGLKAMTSSAPTKKKFSTTSALKGFDQGLTIGDVVSSPGIRSIGVE